MRHVQTGRIAATVVFIGLEMDAMGMVRETLQGEAVLPSSSTSFGDALDVVTRTRPHVAIVDFQDHMDAALHLGQALHKDAPSVTLVALANDSSADAILAAMRMGYKEFIVLPGDANRLRQVVHEAAYAPDDDEGKGMVVSLCGAKGGVGTTLLCTNLASELGAIYRVLCIDLDFSMGDVAPILDLNPKDDISDLLPRADRIDERMLTGTVAVHRSKVHALAQPGDLSKLGEVRPDDIFSVINAAAKGYQFVIMDVGVSLDGATEMALSVSDKILMITTPDVVAVRDTYRRLKVMERFGIERQRIKLVVNMYPSNPYVTISQIESILQTDVVATINHDPRVVDQAVNNGLLVRDVKRKSEVANDISRLVAQLDESEEPRPRDEDKRSGFLFGLFGRE